MAITFSAIPDSYFSSHADQFNLIKLDLAFALSQWTAHVSGNANLKISISLSTVAGSGTLAEAGTSTVSTIGRAADGNTLVMAGAMKALLQGGSSDPSDIDVGITSFGLSRAWFDPNPTSLSAKVPSGQPDMVSILSHEIGHGLGIIGYRDWDTGIVAGRLETTFDQYVTTVSGKFFFSGPNAVAAYGGLVPLAAGDLYHVGVYNSAILSSGAYDKVLQSDLMNPFSSNGTRTGVSALDLALLEDSGLVVTNIGSAVNRSITGTSGNDVLGGFDNGITLTGGAGNDTLTGGLGTDTAIYSGRVASFSVTAGTAGGYTVRDLTGAEGTDTLSNIEKIKFSNTVAFDPTLATAVAGAPVAARAAADVAGAIANQMAVVYYGRPIGADLLQTYATLNGGQQPGDSALQQIASAAQQDGAFAASDGSRDIVVHTFNNIMGFLPSAFEQGAWAQYIDNGTLTRVNAPWVIFQSYLGATNVPAIYQLPTQARFIAAQTFSDYAYLSTQASALDSLNSASANAARSWLNAVHSVADAAAKMQTLLADVATVTLTGVASSPPEL